MQAELFTSDQSESKIWEISEINASIRKLLEQNLSHIWLRGEISNLKSYSSGHFYFQLKDEISQLKGVLFKGDARNQASPPGGFNILFLAISPSTSPEETIRSRKTFIRRRSRKP